MKKRKIRKITYLIILIICFNLLKYFSNEIKLDNINDKYIRYIVEQSNNIKTSNKKEKIFQLRDIYNIEKIINNDYKYLYEKEETKEVMKELKKETPIIYIYNTHQKEKYSISNSEPHNIIPTVMTTSYMLEEQFKKNGFISVVEEDNVQKILNKNGWNYASSYRVTKMFLNNASNRYPTLKYFIDVHRDSVKRSITTIEIDKVKYARILFVLGLENENYKKNLKVIEYINNEINKKYPGISRGIYKKKGANVNGIYNQDFSTNCMLIEFGGQDNTIDEVYNTVIVVAKEISNYIGGTNEK